MMCILRIGYLFGNSDLKTYSLQFCASKWDFQCKAFFADYIQIYIHYIKQRSATYFGPRTGLNAFQALSGHEIWQNLVMSSLHIVVLELYNPISRKTRKKSFEKNAIEVWNHGWDKPWDIDIKWIYFMMGRHLSLKFISIKLYSFGPKLEDYSNIRSYVLKFL